MILFLFITLVTFLVYLCFKDIKKPYLYPPGPGWYPFIGSSHVFTRLARSEGGSHLALQKLCKQYNTNVLGLKLGPEKVVVVSSYPVVKKILLSEEYDGRPDNFFIRLRSMGTKKGITSADGELWTIQRRFVVQHLRDLGFGKGYMEDMVKQQLLHILDVIEQNEDHVVMGEILSKPIMNILWAMTAGSAIPEAKLNKLFSLMARRTKIFDMAGGILNQFPWLRFVAPEKTGYTLMQNFNKELKEFFMDIINEHKESWREDRKDDVIYSFITEMKKKRDDPHTTFTEDQLVMVCADIFIAGGKTTSTFLDFAFLMMALHPEVQHKIHKELDGYLNGKKTVDFSDKQNLPYTKAVLFEIERFCHVTPITGPRRVLADTVLEGYRIPKETTVLINSYSVHNDEEFWKDPQNFRPERFFGDDGSNMNTERLIPFGQGKRRCFGEALARSCMFIFFAGILKKYRVEFAPESQKKVRKIFVPGIILTPEPYVLKLTKRKVY
ncbi:probable cytochrome P450 305a1 isoform X1 [Agrilus planipennis]|uniref:Probable cytochrome P450 305a1 isoform X1 n=1 Tax=Agrilus planipennis TaxID=224129 RepID=A0A1W4WN12_AGRPL|nr:probable cytochrome P450 305a1 isoform X2 [Agrilus planipennis]XP_025837690.1 probable cytochrome P450 305a1 isoform X1 [Agrilus planipennis]